MRRALTAIGLALPGKRIIVNLAPADLAKEGRHFDLPIALAPDDVARHVCLGELGLDGSIAGVAGVLPAAMFAAAGSHNLQMLRPINRQEISKAYEKSDISGFPPADVPNGKSLVAKPLSLPYSL